VEIPFPLTGAFAPTSGPFRAGLVNPDGEAMTDIEILTAIGGTKSLATLDGFARTVWQTWGAQEITDEQAQALAEAIEARKREVRGMDTVAQRAPHVAAQAKARGRG